MLRRFVGVTTSIALLTGFVFSCAAPVFSAKPAPVEVICAGGQSVTSSRIEIETRRETAVHVSAIVLWTIDAVASTRPAFSSGFSNTINPLIAHSLDRNKPQRGPPSFLVSFQRKPISRWQLTRSLFSPGVFHPGSDVTVRMNTIA